MSRSEDVGSFLDLPPGVKVLKPWFPLVRRARERGLSGGLSVVRIVAIVNERGYPIHWLEPEAARVEPCGSAGSLEKLLEELAK